MIYTGLLSLLLAEYDLQGPIGIIQAEHELYWQNMWFILAEYDLYWQNMIYTGLLSLLLAEYDL